MKGLGVVLIEDMVRRLRVVQLGRNLNLVLGLAHAHGLVRGLGRVPVHRGMKLCAKSGVCHLVLRTLRHRVRVRVGLLVAVPWKGHVVHHHPVLQRALHRVHRVHRTYRVEAVHRRHSPTPGAHRTRLRTVVEQRTPVTKVTLTCLTLGVVDATCIRTTNHALQFPFVLMALASIFRSRGRGS